MRDFERIAPSGDATSYDRSHLMLYAELLDADSCGITWREGASDMLGIDPVMEPETARLCWESHLARARWLIGEGLASAVETFGQNPHA